MQDSTVSPESRRWPGWLREVLPLSGWPSLALLLGTAAALWLDPLFGRSGDSLAGWLAMAVLNGIPCALLLLLLFALSRRLIVSSVVAIALYAAVVAVSAIKLEQLGLPLLPADFGFLSSGGGLSLFWHYVEWRQALLLAGLCVLAALALWAEPAQRPRGAMRAGLGLVAVAGLASLLSGASFWRYGYDGWNRGFEPWSPAETVARLGVAPTLLLYRWELSRPDRQAPDRDRVLEFVAEHAQAFGRAAALEPAEELPDIVVVQSESFFDPARLVGVEERDSLPNFRRLAAQGWSGDMSVPTFAGGTIRTEFEVLSGVPLAAFPGVEYPYFELVDAPMPGLMRTLAAQGYSTTVLHPNDAAFWNRRDALQRLGAQRFLALPEFAAAPKSGLFVADAALTDRVVAELKEDGPPQFLFAISMEAHGPYEVSPGLDADTLAAIPLPAALDEYGARTLRHFLYHAANADRELGRLAEVLRQRARPTVLLFYGDHLPGLHSSFSQLGFMDGQPARQQPVPYLILDSRRAALRLEQTRSWMLPAILLEAAKVPPDAYLALIAALRQTPAALLPGGDAAAPEGRFVELARLRVRDEFDLGDYAAVLGVEDSALDDEAATN
ncbi:phosphoglycerol transferase MdoB-like AlkP superfamily enzyme [Tahibacter aquaticus]|uniref:Phosphoglycerol transferase MdoB-like AlkP superfamily enzyme n=1 Tax=Tahibacter aquaticus TaxID=520092 RepID=A0A4R6YML7_9GAMM|nr:LTA synthase family protein [Tahibacter aquaticus]TDR38715.1 phosphoglycerol transferase MdoB-like AlkP superfamily enzyme [Tahibacter aquaticus]